MTRKPVLISQPDPLTVYFDTNVYRYIRERGEILTVRELLRSYRALLIISSGNLLETLAIRSRSEQRAELDAKKNLQPKFEEKPESWRHANELRNELRRKRPQWIRGIQFKRSIRYYLENHKAKWRAVQEDDLDALSSTESYALYRRDSEAGVANQRDFQKELRNRRSQLAELGLFGPSSPSMDVNMSNPEVFWRVDGLLVWYSSIELRSPASRDYADWIGPYLKPGVFNGASYADFWLQDASGEAMRLNRLTGLVSFYQLEEKITHGNAADQLHASNWLLYDVFFTADRAFHSVLNKIAGLHERECASLC